MNNFQIVAKNTFVLTLSEFFLKIISVIWVIFIAHALSVELYGRYNFVNAFIGIFSFLPDLGVGLIVIREIAKDKNNVFSHLGDSLILNGSLALITSILILLTTLFFGYAKDTGILIIIAAFTLLVSAFRSVGIFYFDGMEKMGYSAMLNSINSILLLIGGFLGFILGYGLEGVFIGMLSGSILSLFLTWSIVLKFIVPKISFDPKPIKKLLLNGLPLGIAAFSALIYTKIDTIILHQMLGEHSVGIYNSATPFIFASIQLLNVPFMAAVYPALSRLSNTNARFINAFKKSIIIIALWSFPFAFIVSTFSPFFITLIFGEKYTSAIPILRILIFFVPFACLSALLYKVLIVISKQKIYLVISTIGAIVNIILNLFLIPRYLILGAAIASVLTQIILFSIYFIVVVKYISNKR